MTHAIDILRHAGGFVVLRATELFERLAILEDRRRTQSFHRARPHIAPDLAQAIEAFRGLCPDLDCEAYSDDVQALNHHETELVRAWLDASNIDGEAQEAWLQHAFDQHGIHVTEDGWFTDEVFCCELHDVWYSRRTVSHDVVVRWRSGIQDSETWSDDAVEESAFYCDGSQQYYASSAFDSGRTIDGETVCDTWAELNGYWSDDDGFWRYEDPDDDDEHCPIPAYHDADRPWSMRRAQTAATAYYGLEIELCFDDAHERLDYFEEAGFPTADLTAERDGSLDDDDGLEVISRPFSLIELRQHRNPLQQAMELAVQYEAASPSPAGYGVHITTNAQRLTRDHRRRLVDATYDMRALTEFVAGRKNDADNYNYGNKISRAGCKYTAINERFDGSFEFRVFQGTPDWQVLMSYVEYIDALTEWTRNPANPTHGPVGQALFRAWTYATGYYPALSRRFTSTLSKEAVTCALPLLSRAA